MDQYPGLPTALADELKAVRARHRKGRSAPDDVAFLLELVDRAMRDTVQWIKHWESAVLTARGPRSGGREPESTRARAGDARPLPIHPESVIAERTFLDTAGRACAVYESTLTARDGRSRACLVFECGSNVQGLCTFPGNWREMDTDALVQLGCRP